MTKRIVITGVVTPKVDPAAVDWLIESISAMRPDELVCYEATPEFLGQVRDVFDGPFGVHTGAIDPRYSVTHLPAIYDIAPGWVSAATVGDTHARVAGASALQMAKTLGKSVVTGETCRLGMGSFTKGYRDGKTVTGLEVGHLAAVKGARSLNYQRGLGILTVTGVRVLPEPVPFVGRR